MTRMTRCYFCKGGVIEKKIRHVHRWGDNITIFENVPAEVCQQCGEIYFRPDVLEWMDEAVLEELKRVQLLSATGPSIWGKTGFKQDDLY